MPRIFNSLAESSSSAAELRSLALRATSHQLPNGIEVNSGNLNIKVTALRDDVLRVTLYHEGALPEDASWAVLRKLAKALYGNARIKQRSFWLSHARAGC